MKCIKERLTELRKIQDAALAGGPGTDEEEKKMKDFLGHMLLSQADMSLEELAMNTADLLSAGVDTVSNGWSHCIRVS